MAMACTRAMTDAPTPRPPTERIRTDHVPIGEDSEGFQHHAYQTADGRRYADELGGRVYVIAPNGKHTTIDLPHDGLRTVHDWVRVVGREVGWAHIEAAAAVFGGRR